MHSILSTIICVDSQNKGYTRYISNDGEVCSFGDHVYTSDSEEDFTEITTNIVLKHITAIDCGDSHTVCLDNNGILYTFGSNEFGQLGVGTDEGTLNYSMIPIQVDTPPMKEISCGDRFSICLSESGELYSFGDNADGQLGIGNFEDCYSPQKIESLSDIESIRCGGNFVFCISFENKLFTWGDNIFGQLGLGFDGTVENLPILCSNRPDNIIDIKCGWSHTLTLTSNQEVFSCGGDEDGQLGRVTSEQNCKSSFFGKIDSLTEIKRIECGCFHSMCIDNYDQLYVFGYNKYGELGLGDTDSREKPIKHPILLNVIDISSGGNHTFIKNVNNEIYGFGRNDKAQLGIETKENNQLIPIRVFQDTQNTWYSSTIKKRAKSARK